MRAARAAAPEGKIHGPSALPVVWTRPNHAGAPPLANTDGEQPPVPRRVKDFIDISEYTSLDDLIRYLEAIRDGLPKDAEAELKIRGDDVFGRRLTITYLRQQTPEEAELEAKYSADETEDPGIEQLRRKLDEVPYKLGKAKRS
jgi:hypothetical protein